MMLQSGTMQGKVAASGGLSGQMSKPTGGGGTITEEQIADAVEAYLDENPVGGVYVGSGEAPPEAVVQIDPNGEALDASFITDMIAEAITAYDTEALALLGEDGDTE